MPKSPANLPSGVRATDIFTVTQFATVFPMAEFDNILQRFNRATVRVRDLPNECIVYFVMMLALFRDCSHREVYRCVSSAMATLLGKKEISIPSAAALSKARDRVKDEPLKEFFHSHAVPCGQANQAGVWFGPWRKMALDGCLLNTDDTLANRSFFGCATNQHSKAAGWPQLRFVGLMEVGTHVFIGAAAGGYHTGEITLAQNLVPLLKPDMICIADRNFFSFLLFKSITEQGAALLFRVQRGMSFDSKAQLSDGSHLVTIYDSKDLKKEHGLDTRLVQYKVDGSPNKETIYLITNILKPEEAPAQKLAELYHERWEYENALDELKTHLNAKAITLRSKKPELVLQEFWGMLMAHYVIRRTMNDAAIGARSDPDRLSFTHTIRVISRTLIKSSDFSP
jgi:hypothetical protein